MLASFSRTGVAMLDVDLAPRSLFLPHFDRAGIPYEEWDSTELARRVPGIDVHRNWPPKRRDDDEFWVDSPGTLGAVFTPDGGYVGDPQLAAENLATAARRHGASFLFRGTVTAVEQSAGRVSGVALHDGTRLSAPVVVNAAGPWSSQLNKLAGVGDDFTVRLRPLRQEVHHVQAPAGSTASPSPAMCLADMDLGTYMRPETGGGLLIGGTEPECDPLEWIDDPDELVSAVTTDRFQTQVTRAARRLPDLGVPHRPRGVAGVYDVSDDWTPLYDRTALAGFYIAIGTSGNQFKNAPTVGQLMAALVDAVENGADHDIRPVQFVTKYTKETIDLSAFSRRRARNEYSTGTVLG